MPPPMTPEAGGRPGTRSREPVLEARGVRKSYGRVTALDGVDLAVPRGACLALVGESGSGKTTLLRCFNGMVTPDAGEVRVRDRSLAERDPVRLRREIGYVQQEGGLLPHWTVARNASLVPALNGAPDARERGERALERVGLPPESFGQRWPRRLSGGQRQRVALARALAHEPEVILLDEPFSALDALTRAEMQTEFRSLVDGLGVTALLVTHDLREAFLLADRVAVMRSGRVEQVADPGTLRQAPATAYVRSLLERVHLRETGWGRGGAAEGDAAPRGGSGEAQEPRHEGDA